MTRRSGVCCLDERAQFASQVITGWLKGNPCGASVGGGRQAIPPVRGRAAATQPHCGRAGQHRAIVQIELGQMAAMHFQVAH